MYSEKTYDILSLTNAQDALNQLVRELHLFRDYVSIFKTDIDEEYLDVIDNDVIDAFECLKAKLETKSQEIIKRLIELEEKAHSDFY